MHLINLWHHKGKQDIPLLNQVFCKPSFIGLKWKALLAFLHHKAFEPPHLLFQTNDNDFSNKFTIGLNPVETKSANCISTIALYPLMIIPCWNYLLSNRVINYSFFAKLRDKSICNFKSTSIFSKSWPMITKLSWRSIDCFKLLEIASINQFFFFYSDRLTS
jgi:hypothetical protein